MVATAPPAASPSGRAFDRCLRPSIAIPALALAWFAAAWLGAFHVDYNDFWGIAFYARALSLSEPASLHNGFYPIGYPFLLRAVGGASSLHAAIALNALAAALLVFAAARLAREVSGRVAACVAAALLVPYPLVFRYATVPGPDTGAAALCCLGAWMLVREMNASESPRRLAAAGAIVGAAALFRYHALVLAVGLLLGYTVACAIRRRSVAAWLGLAAAYAVQVIVNLAAGRGPFETAQAFNVYRMVHDVAWHSVADLHVPDSALAVVAAAPGRFLSAYAHSVGRLVFLLVPSLVALLPVWPRALTRPARLFTVAIALFIAVVALGASSRASLVALPLCFAQIAALFGASVSRWRTSVATPTGEAEAVVGTSVDLRPVPGARRFIEPIAIACLAALLIVPWAREDFGVVRARRRTHARNVRLEELMRTAGLTRASQVFTDDFSFYLPGLAPAAPYVQGGWPQIGIHGFRDAFPSLCVKSVDCLAVDAARHGIRFLVLGPGAGGVMTRLGEVYRMPSSEGALEFLGAVGDMKVFVPSGGVRGDGAARR